MELVRAAGGLLWRRGPDGLQLALVRKADTRVWTLPKGRLRPREDFHQGAVREVEEETGCSVRLGEFAGSTTYLSRRGPKLVMYWHMQLRREGALAANGEIDAVAWATPGQALKRLGLERDRRLLRRVLRQEPAAVSAS